MTIVVSHRHIVPPVALNDRYLRKQLINRVTLGFTNIDSQISAAPDRRNSK